MGCLPYLKYRYSDPSSPQLAPSESTASYFFAGNRLFSRRQGGSCLNKKSQEGKEILWNGNALSFQLGKQITVRHKFRIWSKEKFPWGFRLNVLIWDTKVPNIEINASSWEATFIEPLRSAWTCHETDLRKPSAKMHQNSLLAALFSAGTALATPTPVRPAVAASRSACVIKCPIIFDGRVPNGTAVTYFDTSNSLFNPDYVKGANLKWSQILQVPSVTKSKFDTGGYEPIEVTISDASIFNNQTGFRRAGLQFSSDSSTGPGDSGVKTIHWSVKQDPAKPMNLSHEYLVRLFPLENAAQNWSRKVLICK